MSIRHHEKLPDIHSLRSLRQSGFFFFGTSQFDELWNIFHTFPSYRDFHLNRGIWHFFLYSFLIIWKPYFHFSNFWVLKIDKDLYFLSSGSNISRNDCFCEHWGTYISINNHSCLHKMVARISKQESRTNHDSKRFGVSMETQI